MKSDFTQILKEASLKVTPARVRILDIFSLCLCKPINAEYISEKLKGKNINYVTIYRTLEVFEKKGILKRVDLRKESVYYELADHHHHHIVCTKCGKTEGFVNCNIEKISQQVLKRSPLFKSIDQHSLELFGLCRSCSKG